MKKVRENINTVDYWNGRFMREGDHVWDTMNIIPHLSKRLPDGVSVFDVGLGGGVVMSRLHESRADLKYYGCDFSSTAIRLLRKRPDMQFFRKLFVYDLRDPVQERFVKAFDVVVCTEVLEHIEHPEDAVAKLVQMARTRVIITAPLGNSIRSPEHIWEFQMEDIENFLLPYGVVQVQGVRRWRNIMGMVDLYGTDKKPD